MVRETFLANPEPRCFSMCFCWFLSYVFYMNLLGYTWINFYTVVKQLLPFLNPMSAEDLKRELLQYLANRDCLMLFPGFLSYLDGQL